MENSTGTGLLGMLPELWDSLESAPASLAEGLTYAKGMHGRPLSYYVARVEKLGLRGETVLDAGCGTGTWSFALRTKFDKVVGLDLSLERITVAKWLAERSGLSGMAFRVGSLLDTGLPDDSVDAVFCYSVLISAIPAREALAEFHRILKPGGVVYVCLNGLGWFHYLRDERGRDDAGTAEMGRAGTYNTLVRGLPAHELEAIRSYGRHGPPPSRERSALEEQLTVRLLRRLPLLADSRNPVLARRLASGILKRWADYLSPPGMPRCALHSVAGVVDRECGGFYTVQLALDVQQLAAGERTDFSHATAGRGYATDEIWDLCRSVGLIDFQWACEGLLAGALATDPPEPIHDGYFQGHLKVWEFFAFKPDTDLSERIPPDWFRRNARTAGRLPYLAQARLPVMTNVDPETVPSGWVVEARRRAEASGGDRLVAALAGKLCADAADDDDCVERLVRFVQDALVHHPIVQPFSFNGSAVSDPATLLFLGIGRCGAAARLLAALCLAAGFAARVESVAGHVFCICEAGGRDLILESDILKKGVMLRDPESRLLGYEAFLENPRIADALPNFTVWSAVHHRAFTDVWGRRPFGYLDSDSRLRLYSSYFEPGAELRYLPRVPVLRAGRNGTRLALSWTDATPLDGSRLAYRVAVRDTRRGWGYEQEPTDLTSVLAPPPADHEQWVEGATEVEIDWPSAGYAEVTPQLEQRPDVFCWPSNETATEP